MLFVLIVAAVGVAAQTGYGSVTPTPPACDTGSFVEELTPEQAAEFMEYKNIVYDFDNLGLIRVFNTRCFGTVVRELSSLAGLTCENAAVYKVDLNGNIGLWPFTCDSDPNVDLFTFQATGLPGHIIVFARTNQNISPVPLLIYSNTL